MLSEQVRDWTETRRIACHVFMTGGGSRADDCAMSVGTSSAATGADSDGFLEPIQGYDSPVNRTDWPNANVALSRSSMCVAPIREVHFSVNDIISAKSYNFSNNYHTLQSISHVLFFK